MIKYFSRLDLKGSRIDRENGVIKGVSLIALGDARGHNKQVDQKTLETVRDCAKQYGGGLRVKFNPSTFQHGVGSLLGYIPPDTIRIENNKTVGDLHLYENFPSEAKEYLYEIAEKTPGNIGLSIEFSGDDEVINEDRFARCDQIYAATVVDLPAANPTGLFSGDLTNPAVGTKTAEKKDIVMDEDTIKKLSIAIAEALKPSFDGIKQMFAANGNGNGDNKGKKKNGNGDQDEDDQEEMAAAGVTDGDDEKTKAEKLAAYRGSLDKPVSAMSGRELIQTITRGNMTFFRETGNRPARVNAEPKRRGDEDPFEARVKQQMANGCKSRGLAIMRARRDAPAEYNAFMARKNPNVQHMAGK